MTERRLHGTRKRVRETRGTRFPGPRRPPFEPQEVGAEAHGAPRLFPASHHHWRTRCVSPARSGVSQALHLYFACNSPREPSLFKSQLLRVPEKFV